MADRILVAIEDDWELAGNGAFHVATHQYVPALFLMNTARELGIPVTFMVEVCQQMAFLRCANADAEIRLQSRLWHETVFLMKSWGFDVQLHIHPQWEHAVCQRRGFRVGRDWNLATYPAEVRRRLLADGIAHLRQMLCEIDPQHEIHSFKAGSWGLQPSAGLQADLRDVGIELVLGVAKGMRLESPEFHADYSDLEEDTLPYCPNPCDICRVARSPQSLVVVPLPWWRMDGVMRLQKIRGKLARFWNRGATRHSHAMARLLATEGTSPPDPSPLAPSQSQTALAKLRRLCYPYRLEHLELGGGMHLSLMKRAFDQVVNRLRNRPEGTVPLILETHTKSYWGAWDEVRQFLRYAVDRYGAILEFVTLTDLRNAIRSGTLPMRGTLQQVCHAG